MSEALLTEAQPGACGAAWSHWQGHWPGTEAGRWYVRSSQGPACLRTKEQWWAVLVSQLRNPWSSWAWGVMCPLTGWPVGVSWGWVGTSFVLLEVGHAYFRCRERAMGMRQVWWRPQALGLHSAAGQWDGGCWGPGWGPRQGTAAILHTLNTHAHVDPRSYINAHVHAHMNAHTYRPYFLGVGVTYGWL